ncbi:CapA family protein [Paenibacillus koleovorans]|uniref:CapA family protein n=1 Tax=Paenibacillus koleovorans TaxID=121608 RepID=UPI000FDC4977|nr:CapA family protein [Paenibacillus koleovorans]
MFTFTKMEKIVGLLLIVILLLSVGIGFELSRLNPDSELAEALPGHSAAPSPTPSAVQSARPAPTLTPTPTPTPTPAPVVSQVTLAAIGDVLIHNSVYRDAMLPNGGGYDFTPMFSQVRDMLQRPDLLMANSESIIGGSELGLSSYPLFNSPHEVGDALKDSGVDLVTMANNHAMDMREPGILAAAAYWDRIGMPYTGAFVSQEDHDRIRLLVRNDISFAFLSYTYGTNGIPVPANKPYLVNRTQDAAMENEIARAKQLADVVVVAMHWGSEDQMATNANQIELARRLSAWGADIVIGTHPHVLQPFEWVEREDGMRTLVMYSLGNFLSAQDQPLELIGGIGQIEVVKTVKNGAATITLQNPAFTPTYNRYENFRNYRIVPWLELSPGDYDKMNGLWLSVKARMMEKMPELRFFDAS